MGKSNSELDKSKNSQSKKKKHVLFQKFLVLSISEVVSTAILICFGCMGGIVTGAAALPHHVPALTFGLVVMITVQAFGHISGAHMNPAVTLCSVLLGMLKPLTGIVYVISQFIGAVLGFGLLKLLVPPEFTKNEIFDPVTNETIHQVGLCSTVVNPKITAMQGLAFEIILTVVLILVCCGVWDKRNIHNTDSISLRFGLTISCIAMFAGPITGVSLNTVRSFAPALYNKDWDNHWIYWVGPTIGSIVGTFFYKTVFSVPLEDTENKDDDVENVPLNEKINRI